MSVLATPERMSGTSATRWYDAYGRMPVHALRAVEIRGRFTNLGSRILVAGCGNGAVVDELTQRGYTSVYGCDAAARLIARRPGYLVISGSRPSSRTTCLAAWNPRPNFRRCSLSCAGSPRRWLMRLRSP